MVASLRSRILKHRRWWVLVAACLGVLMAVLDVTIVNVALPTMQHQLRATFSQLQWIINAYNLALAVCLPLAGRIGDLFGRRKIFTLGLGVFCAGSVLAGLSGQLSFGISGIDALLGSRALQAIGGAALLPVSLAIVGDAFPEPKERGLAMGFRGSMAGVGITLGPIASGLLIRYLSWPWIFYVNVPIGGLAVALTYLAIRESRDERASRKVDWLGLTTLACAVFLLIWGLIRIEDAAHASLVRILWPFGACAAAAALFIFTEFRAPEPIVDLRMYRVRSFAAVDFIVFTLSAALLTSIFFLTLYLQDVLHLSALQTGLRLLPMTVLVGVTAPAAGRLMSRISPRWLLTGGMALTAAGVYLLGVIRPGDTARDWLVIVPGLVLLGVGVGATNAPVLNVAVSTVERGKAGVAAGMTALSRRIGGAFGIAVFGLLLVVHAGSSGIAATDDKVRWVHAFTWTLPWAALVVALGAIAALLFVTRADLRGDEHHESPVT